MNIPQSSVRDLLYCLVEEQQLVYGGEINPLVLAVRNRTPTDERVLLLLMLSGLVNAKPAVDIRRWLPEVQEPRRCVLFFRAMRDIKLQFLLDPDEKSHSFLDKLDVIWRLI